MRVRIRDEDGTLHDRGTGRLVVTSRWLSSGYWDDREGTAAVLTTEDGSQTFLTSDTGTIDDRGCMRLLGRTDHSVKIGGQLVEPGEVDAVLFAQPVIREAVVVGVTSPTTGRARLAASVVPAVPRLQAASVRRAVRDVLPGFMVPRQVVFLTALPRKERGKLDRSALPAPPESRAGPGSSHAPTGSAWWPATSPASSPSTRSVGTTTSSSSAGTRWRPRRCWQGSVSWASSRTC